MVAFLEMREIKRVIVHCLDTPDYPLHGVKHDFGVDDVNEWHVKRGFDSCGYHDVIKRDGTIEKGRPLKDQGAHCKGQNADTIGVAYAGRKRPTWPQLQAMVYLFREYHNQFGIEPDAWYGHNNFNNKKTCPGFNMDMLRMIFTCALG